MKRGAIIGIGLLLVLFAVMWGIGTALPVAHVASGTRMFDRPPEDVYQLVSAVEDYPRWWHDVNRIDVLSRDEHGRVTFRQHAADGPVIMKVVEQQPPTRFVTGIADPDQPFGGTWTFDISRQGGRTQLAITERGEVYNPMFRFLSRFVFGHTGTIERFLMAATNALPPGA